MERRAGGRFFFLCLVLWMLHISCFSPDERMCDETTAVAAAAALHKHWEGSQGTYWVEVGSASTLRGEIRGLWIDQCTLGKSHILTFRCFFVFFWFWPVNQQLEPLLLFPKLNVFGKQSTRQLNHALKWELFADLMHLSVSPAHFT